MQHDRRLLVTYFIVAVLTGLLLLGTCVYQGLKDLEGPPASPEAKARAEIVRRIPPRGIGIPGATFIGETADPGRPDGGTPATLGRRVLISRAYEVSGFAGACDAAAAHFAASGWRVGTACIPDDRIQGAEGKRACQDFEATVNLTIVRQSADLTEVRVRVSAPYPKQDEPRTKATSANC